MSKDYDDNRHGGGEININADPETQKRREIKEKRRVENWQRKQKDEFMASREKNGDQELNYKKPTKDKQELEWITNLKEKHGQNTSTRTEPKYTTEQHEEIPKLVKKINMRRTQKIQKKMGK